MVALHHSHVPEMIAGLAYHEPPRKRGPKRVCAKPGCDTILSIYNPQAYCSIHIDDGPTLPMPKRPVAPEKLVERLCAAPGCPHTFMTNKSNKRYCSDACRRRANKVNHKEAAMASSREALLGILRERPGERFKTTDLAFRLGVDRTHITSLARQLRDGGQPVVIVPKSEGGGIYYDAPLEAQDGLEADENGDSAAEKACDAADESGEEDSQIIPGESAKETWDTLAREAPADELGFLRPGATIALNSTGTAETVGAPAPEPDAADLPPRPEPPLRLERECMHGSPQAAELFSRRILTSCIETIFSTHPERLYGCEDLCAITGYAAPAVYEALDGLLDEHMIESPYPGGYRRVERITGEALLESKPMHPEAKAFSDCCDALEGASAAQRRRVITHLVELFVAGDGE